jgi:hypothetical protein
MARTKNEKKKAPKAKAKNDKRPHFVLEVQDSVMGQASIILPKENTNGNNQSLA